MIIKRFVGLSLTILILFYQIIPVQALSRSVGLDAFEFEKDLLVKAPQSSIELDFPVPRLARINSASITFSLAPGPRLNDETQFFFHLNDKLLETRTAKDFRQNKYQTINLPRDGEFGDSVRVQVKSNMFISNDICRDYYSGKLFFTVHKDTKLNLNYDMLPVRSVADFFGIFQQSLLIVVPNNAGLSEMMPAVWVYGILKKNYPHLDIQLAKAGKLPSNKAAAPRIWVGLRNQLPAYFGKTQAGIALADSNTLLLSAGTVPELESVARQLSEQPIFPVNLAASRKIAVNAKVGEPPAETAGVGIAFGNKSVQEGVLQVATEFQLYPSLMGRVPEKTGFHLEGAHMVSFDQSHPARLDVFFNSKLIHSSVLDQTGQFKRDVALPAGTGLLTKNKLNLQFNYAEDAGQCKIRNKLNSAQIFPTSFMWGSGQKKVDHLMWSNAGMFLGQQGTVVVDERLSDDPLQLLAGLIVFLNRQLPPSTYTFPGIQALADLAFIPTDQYVVALAMNGNLPPFVQEMLPRSQGQGSPGYQAGGSAMAVEFQPNVKSVVGKIAEYKGFPLIVFSTNLNGNLLADALKFLTNPRNYAELTGNIMTFIQPGRLYSLDVRDADKTIAGVQTNNNINRKTGILWWDQYNKEIIIIGAVLIGIILLLVFLGYLRKRRLERDSEWDATLEDGEPEAPLLMKPKRRGRPKKKLQDADDFDDFTEETHEFINLPTAEPAPKRRGRPKKQVAEPNESKTKTNVAATAPATVIIPSAPTAEPAPKRRGRPKKQVVEPIPTDTKPEPVVVSEAKSRTSGKKMFAVKSSR